MARITWIKQKLDAWASWARSKDSGILGYPKQSAFLRMAVSGATAGAAVPLDSLDAGITEQAVQSLRFSHPHVWLTIKTHYVEDLEIRRCAKKLSVAESTIKARLDAGDALLAAWFSARAEVQQKMREQTSAHRFGGSARL